ncbi:MAG TPA: hypothetical protein VIV66_06050 [Pyrinomonadaceae bacterium]
MAEIIDLPSDGCQQMKELPWHGRKSLRADFRPTPKYVAKNRAGYLDFIAPTHLGSYEAYLYCH